MINIVKNMVNKSDIFENFNRKRYDEDNTDGDILLWYDRPQVIYLTYFNKNYTLTLYDDFKMDENWVDIYIIEDVTGIDKKVIHDQLFGIIDENPKSTPMFGIIIDGYSVIDYVEIIN